MSHVWRRGITCTRKTLRGDNLPAMRSKPCRNDASRVAGKETLLVKLAISAISKDWERYYENRGILLEEENRKLKAELALERINRKTNGEERAAQLTR